MKHDNGNKNASLDQLMKDGFSLHDGDYRGVTNMALLALRSAVRSYFSTYSAVSGNLELVLRYKDRDKLHLMYPTEYLDRYSATILSFHHFFELFCKDILRDEYELLVLDIERKHDILMELLSNPDANPTSLENVKTIEFGLALERVCHLLKGDKLQNSDAYRFVLDSEQMLNKLNSLRNRIIHRGSFVMFYPSFDKLVGKHILPFVQQAVASPLLAPHERIWKHVSTSCGKDPIAEIISHTASNDSPIKVALWKEVGRASYAFSQRKTGKYKRVLPSEGSAKSRGSHLLRDCPVCGFSSLIGYHSDYMYRDEQNVVPEQAKLIGAMECLTCGLEFDGDLEQSVEMCHLINEFITAPWPAKG